MTKRKNKKHQQQAEDLAVAYARYQVGAAALAAIRQCPSYWPKDLPGENYPGTRCDLVVGHPSGVHRARVPGSSVVVTW